MQRMENAFGIEAARIETSLVSAIGVMWKNRNTIPIDMGGAYSEFDPIGSHYNAESNYSGINHNHCRVPESLNESASCLLKND